MDFVFYPYYAFPQPEGVTRMQAESQQAAEIVSDKAGIQGLLFCMRFCGRLFWACTSRS